MAQTDTDRNLLYGVLALQLGFIDEGGLVEAMREWLARRDEPLARILRARGRTTDEEWPLLDALVSVHLKRHGGDARRGLGELSSLGSVRQVLERLEDTELTSSVAATASVAPDEATRAWHVGGPFHVEDQSWPPGLRFRVVRPHARGGLGEVFVAVDSELNRVVALKQLQERHADDPRAQSRFKLEAEITGGLEHPGIVPVYGLGTYAGGRPFYAMRFIRGDSLKDAIRRFHAVATDDRPEGLSPGERSLELRQLLGRFVDVCEAMAYAHSRGVLHRDLKPGNIMLGRYGETLIVDWGLAKSTDGPTTDADADALDERSDEETPWRRRSGGDLVETMPGSVRGTPEYMSPEQASGSWREIGTSSDVFSLGATLYCLLTGRPPFREADTSSTVAKAARGEFPAPRALNPAVPVGLEAVCLKAMARTPEGRYATPLELARDVERWLADEPVSARREPLSERLGRWARRHRGLVIGSAVALVVALVSLAAVLALQARSNQRLRQANARERAAREQAQARFALARDAIASFHRGVSEDVLLRRPEFRELRRALLKSALEFYRKLTAIIEADRGAGFAPDLSARMDLARASGDLAEITREIGADRDALKAGEQSRALYERLIAERPRDVSLHRALADLLRLVSLLEREVGRPDAGLKTLLDERAVREAMIRDGLATDDDRNALGRGIGNIGNLYDDTGRQAEALSAYAEARAIFQSLVNAHPSAARYESELARVLNNIGGAMEKTGRLDAAVKACEEALAIRRRLVAAHPHDEKLLGDLAGSYTSVGRLREDTGRPAVALEALEQSRAINRKLVAAHPTSTPARRYLSNNENDIGNFYGDHNRPYEALAAYERARTIQQEIVADNPDRLDYENTLATSLTNIGIVHTELGRADVAMPLYEQALAMREKLYAADPSDSNAVSKLAWAHFTIGVLLARQGRHDEAIAELEKSLAVLGPIIGDHPNLSEFRADRARALTALGSEQGELGRWGEAARPLEQAGALLEALASAEPDIRMYRSDLAENHDARGRLERRAGRPERALAFHEKARALWARLLADAPDDRAARGHLCESRADACAALLRLGRNEEALAAADAAVEEGRRAFLGATRNAMFRARLANAEANRAETLLALGRPGEAAVSAREVGRLSPRNAERLYASARLLARCSLRPEAIATLRRVAAAGPIDVRRPLNEPAFAPWRNDADFQQTILDIMDRSMPTDPFR